MKYIILLSSVLSLSIVLTACASTDNAQPANTQTSTTTVSLEASALANGYHWQLVNKGKLVVSQSEGGDDQTFPSVIKVPHWVAKENRAHPDAKYYLYYGEHHGMVIKMKWAKHIEGPWTPYNVSDSRKGVMDFTADTDRNQGDNTWKHLASPDVFIDEQQQRFIMSFHGKLKKKLTSQGKTAEAYHGNAIAFSPNGLNFNDAETGGGITGYGPIEAQHGDITRTVYMMKPYARFFFINDKMFTISRKGLLQQPKSQSAPWQINKKAPFGHQWLSQTKANDLYKKQVRKNSKIYHSAIATWFASSEFAAHPNNPYPGKIVSSNGKYDRVNHVGIFQRSNSLLEVFFWVRGDTKKIFGIDDPYNHLYRVMLDTSSANWDDWDVVRDANKQVIFDIVLDPAEIYQAVKEANGGGNINGLTHADPTSMGASYFIEVDGNLYCFVGFHSQDMGGADSEGQIATFKLTPNTKRLN